MRRRSSTRSATGDVWLDAKPRYEKCMVSGTKIWVNGKAVSTKGLGVLGRQGRDTFISSNPLVVVEGLRFEDAVHENATAGSSRQVKVLMFRDVTDRSRRNPDGKRWVVHWEGLQFRFDEDGGDEAQPEKKSKHAEQEHVPEHAEETAAAASRCNSSEPEADSHLRPVGLANPDGKNRCFLNSVLQAIQALQGGAKVHDIKLVADGEKDVIPEGARRELSKQLSKLSTEMAQRKPKLNAEKVRKALCGVCQTRPNPYRRNAQSDHNETWAHLSDAVSLPCQCDVASVRTCSNPQCGRVKKRVDRFETIAMPPYCLETNEPLCSVQKCIESYVKERPMEQHCECEDKNMPHGCRYLLDTLDEWVHFYFERRLGIDLHFIDVEPWINASSLLRPGLQVPKVSLLDYDLAAVIVKSSTVDDDEDDGFGSTMSGHYKCIVRGQSAVTVSSVGEPCTGPMYLHEAILSEHRAGFLVTSAFYKQYAKPTSALEIAEAVNLGPVPDCRTEGEGNCGPRALLEGMRERGVLPDRCDSTEKMREFVKQRYKQLKVCKCRGETKCTCRKSGSFVRDAVEPCFQSDVPIKYATDMGSHLDDFETIKHTTRVQDSLNEYANHMGTDKVWWSDYEFAVAADYLQTHHQKRLVIIGVPDDERRQAGRDNLISVIKPLAIRHYRSKSALVVVREPLLACDVTNDDVVLLHVWQGTHWIAACNLAAPSGGGSEQDASYMMTSDEDNDSDNQECRFPTGSIGATGDADNYSGNQESARKEDNETTIARQLASPSSDASQSMESSDDEFEFDEDDGIAATSRKSLRKRPASFFTTENIQPYMDNAESALSMLDKNYPFIKVQFTKPDVSTGVALVDREAQGEQVHGVIGAEGLAWMLRLCVECKLRFVDVGAACFNLVAVAALTGVDYGGIEVNRKYFGLGEQLMEQIGFCNTTVVRADALKWRPPQIPALYFFNNYKLQLVAEHFIKWFLTLPAGDTTIVTLVALPLEGFTTSRRSGRGLGACYSNGKKSIILIEIVHNATTVSWQEDDKPLPFFVYKVVDGNLTTGAHKVESKESEGWAKPTTVAAPQTKRRRPVGMSSGN
eukprot:SAG11_NODE_2134_length_3773_cov_2.336146_1_plen_1084_part_10